MLKGFPASSLRDVSFRQRLHCEGSILVLPIIIFCLFSRCTPRLYYSCYSSQCLCFLSNMLCTILLVWYDPWSCLCICQSSQLEQILLKFLLISAQSESWRHKRYAKRYIIDCVCGSTMQHAASNSLNAILQMSNALFLMNHFNQHGVLFQLLQAKQTTWRHS